MNFDRQLARYIHLLDCRETIALSAFLVLSKARKAFDCLKEMKETMKGRISSRWTSTENKGVSSSIVLFHCSSLGSNQVALRFSGKRIRLP